MESVYQDIRYAVRVMIKSRGVTVVALLAMALGIGANSAIFSAVNAVLLRSLPYEEPDRLLMIWQNNPQLQLGFDLLPVSAANFVDWRDQNQVFEAVSIIDNAQFVLTGMGTPERVGGAGVSHTFFDLMGVSPILGRAFLAEEDRPGANQVVVISYACWQSRFGADPDIIGRRVTLDDQIYTIVGVMPAGFQFPRQLDLPSYFQLPPQTEMWTPIGLTGEQINNRGSLNKAVIARLKPGVPLAQAQTDLSAIASRIEQQYPESKGFGVTLVPLQEQAVGSVRLALWVLLGAVGFVLLIACANVSNLLLARSAARQKEVAIRVALGASRGRIIRQFLTESVMLSLGGGLLGVLLARWGISALLALSPDNIPRKHEIEVDATVLGFAFAVSLLTGVLFGLAPALQSSRFNLNETLKEGMRGSTGGHNRIRSLLVVSEVALSLVLLVGAGLMLKSFVRLLQVDPGFNPQNLLTMSISLSSTRYPEARQQAEFFKRALERIRNLPGALEVGAVSDLPLSGAEEIDGFTVEGQSPPASLAETPLADFRFIDQNYFNTMGIPLVAGRNFTERDNETAPGVVIINESLARRFFPGQDPVGKRVKGGSYESNRPWLSVVGVIRDVKHSALDADPRPQMYFPYLQRVDEGMTFVVHTGGDPLSLVAAVRGEVWAIDKDQPVTDVKTLDQYLADSVSQRRFNMVLLGAFAAVAIVLASVGIYGVMSYSVTQRTHEIGIRMALGASRRDILMLVVGQGMKVALAGVFVGLGAALALTRVLSSLLYRVSASDPTIFAAISFILVAVAFLASYVPARRATRVDPCVALRYE